MRPLFVTALLLAACSRTAPYTDLSSTTTAGGDNGGPGTSSGAGSSGGVSAGSSGTGTGTTTTTGGGIGGTTTGSSTGSTTGIGSTGSSTGGAPVCMPGVSPDPCAAMGLICHGGFGVGTCGLPEELDPCTTTVGCASSDLTCAAPIPDAPTLSFCLRTCSSLADCPLLITTCASFPGYGSACFYNACGPGWPMIIPSSGPAYYAPCNVTSSGDGICLPAESQLGTVGVCLQGGGVVSGQCANTRADGGMAMLCAWGTICAADDNGNYACNSACAASPNGSVDGGPFCVGGEVCANVGSAQFDFGQCLVSCGGGGTCVSGTCTPLGTESVCYP